MSTAEISETTPSSPAGAANAEVADWATIATPDGPFTVIADDAGVVLASGWTEDAGYLAVLINRAIRPTTLRAGRDLAAVTDPVEAYYSGELTAIDAVAVAQRSGPFLERAWAALRTVRAGGQVSYTTLAEMAGEPAAVRAAAASCARNAAALFVPCHRVLRSDGTLGGFRYGLDIKRSLLDREYDA
ncbi:methylated-DNA--[protein]-cysteine S-methyltransferase [Gordonia sp. ABSL49_1]|uniref:methylated-DNA--[protein]-cysteine S-methyltransferase n=1 Tax=Gordonia sp. ABSL49_1 TaxID=2920941 RepID=UPI0023F56B5D